ncbi:MAG TPA: hypothetical protein VGB07_26550, partial [Blastocatellia bacterium]
MSNRTSSPFWATDIDSNAAAEVQLMIDGMTATVLYASRAPGFTCLNQLNILLPADIASGGRVVRVT